MNEEIIWQGRPSHILNLKLYTFCLLFFWLGIPLLIMLIKAIQLKSTHYELTSQRLKIKTGVFSQNFNEIELYRIKDYEYKRPFLMRLVGRGSLILMTSDQTDSTLRLDAIANGEHLRQTIRDLVQQCRSRHHVRDYD